jgi:hypothetical protein
MSLLSQAHGTSIFVLGNAKQQRVKQLIVGKAKQEAAQLLTSLPGVEQAAIRSNGFGCATRLPKQSGLLRLSFIIVQGVLRRQRQKDGARMKKGKQKRNQKEEVKRLDSWELLLLL